MEGRAIGIGAAILGVLALAIWEDEPKKLTESVAENVIEGTGASNLSEVTPLSDAENYTGLGNLALPYPLPERPTLTYHGDGEDVEEDQPSREYAFDEEAARREAGREMARRGYRGFCSDDCSGHDAGYQWAHENRLRSPNYTFDSPSFDDGQAAYTKDVSRRVEEMRQEFEDDPASSDFAY